VTNNVIQSFWIGPKVNLIGRMSAASFLKAGHRVVVHTYEEVSGMPKGVEQWDASKIMPLEEFKKFKSVSHAIDFFKCAMLVGKGGWWSDLDVICLKPWDFKEKYVFACDNISRLYITNAMFKVPDEASIMTEACLTIAELLAEAKETPGWHYVGPPVMHDLVLKNRLGGFVRSKDTFDAVPYPELAGIVDPNKQWNFNGSYAIHLRTSIWDGGPNQSAAPGLWQEKSYPQGCLYEQLKDQLL
jgi:mannosyltransferase OCH1-like enzyme